MTESDRERRKKGKVLMRFTKKGIMKAAALGSVLVGTLAVAAPASANSFGPTYEGTPGDVVVFYNEGYSGACMGV